MRVLMITAREDLRDELETRLSRAGAPGFTEMSTTAGFGRAGALLGSSAFPGHPVAIVSILPDDLFAPVAVEIADLRSRNADGLLAVHWAAEEIDAS